MSGSSPPSTANPGGASASSRNEPSSIADADDVRGVRQPEEAVGLEEAAGAAGDVVEDDRHRARRGDRLEMGDDPGLARPQVIRDDAQRRGGLGDRGERLGGGDRRAGVVGPDPDDHGCVPLAADAGARVDDRALLVVVKQWRLAGRAERDETGDAGVEVGVGESFERVERDTSVGRERGDERDVDAA